MADILQRHYAISGRVQSVGFRWWTRDTAVSLGLSGWVRNLPDGRVACQAAGSAASLDGFEQRLAEGPPAAKVTGVQVSYEVESETMPDSGFAIRR